MPTISPTEVKKVFELTEQIKELEKEKEFYVSKLKTQMIQTGQSEILLDGHKIQIIKSKRNTFKKNMKDAFMLFLKNKGLTGCLSVAYDVNKETLETELAAGRIEQSEIDSYMSSCEVISMRVTL